MKMEWKVLLKFVKNGEKNAMIKNDIDTQHYLIFLLVLKLN